MSSLNVSLAIFQRNFQSYFAGVLGYLFITIFVAVGALLTFQPQFFADNLANLDQLSHWYHWLLMFFIPAITMTAWADEKKLGTDELLFTLPASDLSILLGKYLAVLGVYTTALVFTFPYLIVLSILGDPDWGILLSTYLGYWLAGLALLSIGLFASSLTGSTPVAYELGAILCAIPIFIGNLSVGSDFTQRFSIPYQLEDFTAGIVSLSGVLYFLSLSIFLLYLNLMVITRRHWGAEQGINMGGHYLLRAVALAALLVSLNMNASYFPFRWDLTSEGSYTLTETTKTILKEIDSEQPITIQAFLSPEVPRDYVPVRNRLLTLLRQFDSLGGRRVDVRLVNVEPFSEEAEEARYLGIQPRRVQEMRDGRFVQEEVFLGAVINSGYDEIVIPFFDLGTPLEYELAMAISTATSETRQVVGVMMPDAEVMSQLNLPSLDVLNYLKRTYEVVSLPPESLLMPENEQLERVDVLMAILPSSMTDPQMKGFIRYLERGKPVLIFDDPIPQQFSKFNPNTGSHWVLNAPMLPKLPSEPHMFMGMQQEEQKFKADLGKATALLDALQLVWEYDQVVIDPFNPHLEYSNLIPEEYIFVTPDNGAPGAISSRSPITSGLQEVMFLYSGYLYKAKNSFYTITPLLWTSPEAEALERQEFTNRIGPISPGLPFEGIELKRVRPRKAETSSYCLAAHIQNESNPRLNVVYLADLDVIGDLVMFEREQNQFNFHLDNLTFLMNSLDVLAGNTKYLELRKRRARNRTLKQFEDWVRDIKKAGSERIAEADEELEAAKEQLKEQFQTRLEEIAHDTSLDRQSKLLRSLQVVETSNQVLETKLRNFERQKQQTREEVQMETERKTRSVERRIQFLTVALTPLPAILMGLLVWGLGIRAERRSIASDRFV